MVSTVLELERIFVGLKRKNVVEKHDSIFNHQVN